MNTELLTEQQAAELLGVSVATLGNWRRSGTGPLPTRLGPRLIRYAREELDRYVRDQTARTTARPAGGEVGL